jgi:hypothetical protein
MKLAFLVAAVALLGATAVQAADEPRRRRRRARRARRPADAASRGEPRHAGLAHEPAAAKLRCPAGPARLSEL